MCVGAQVRVCNCVDQYECVCVCGCAAAFECGCVIVHIYIGVCARMCARVCVCVCMCVRVTFTVSHMCHDEFVAPSHTHYSSTPTGCYLHTVTDTEVSQVLVRPFKCISQSQVYVQRERVRREKSVGERLR